MHRIVLVAFMLLCGMCSVSCAEQFAHEQKIRALVEPFLKHKKVNAISVGVIQDGKIWKGHFGTLSQKNSSPPNDQTVYEIGSISKVFTSLLLADATLTTDLKLDDPIAVLAPEIAEKNPDVGNAVTFQQLSHHISGLPTYPATFVPKDPTNPFAGFDRQQLIDYMCAVQLPRKPGASYEYSNLGAGLLGELLSRQADLTYEELLRKKILTPLKMSDTTVTLSPAQRRRLAPPHNAALLPDESWDFDALAGCGAIRSTLDDMLLFAEANLHAPRGDVGKAIDLAWRQHRPRKGDNLAMGLGWMIALDGTTRWHNGHTGGYHCILFVNRDLKAATVLLSNTANFQLDTPATQIFQTLVGLSVEPVTFEEEIKVSKEVAERLTGKYQLAPGLVFTIKLNNGKMMAQLTGQQFLSLVPKSETEWKYELIDATLKFELPEKGPSPKVTLYQNGGVMPAPRIKEK